MDVQYQIPEIFYIEHKIKNDYDYKNMILSKHDIHKEIIEYIYNPINITKWKEWKL
jgi:hypothetical protein